MFLEPLRASCGQLHGCVHLVVGQGWLWNQSWLWSRAGCGTRAGCGPGLVVEPELVVGQGWLWDQSWLWNQSGCGTRPGCGVRAGPDQSFTVQMICYTIVYSVDQRDKLIIGTEHIHEQLTCNFAY